MFKGDEIWKLLSKINRGEEKTDDVVGDKEQRTFLIAGLGNPGREYMNTRHNVGFLLIDELCRTFDTQLDRVQSKALMTSVKYHGHRIILAKPQTYMNLSGQAVSGIVRYYKVELSDLMVVHDDIDLELGSIRIRPSGGSGGQKGIASIIQQLGTQSFRRLRIGINRPPGRMSAADYVLQKFSDSDKEVLSQVLKKASDAVQSFIRDGLEQSMNMYNGHL